MTDADLVEKIKIRLGITGDYHDALLGELANDVKDFILDAGGDPESEQAVGLIARGVTDLWNFGSGDGTYSQVFFQRLLQMSLPGDSSITGGVKIDPIDPPEIDDVFDEEKE